MSSRNIGFWGLSLSLSRASATCCWCSEDCAYEDSAIIGLLRYWPGSLVNVCIELLYAAASPESERPIRDRHLAVQQ